ncbi:MAG: RecX family transcriptional regulator [Chloroflexota bacterium]|nr:RecX family transcriptional regulator [Chloroflexota bacterium]
MRITALETQATNHERVNIFVDGQFLMGTSTLVVLQLGLAPGQELSPAQLEQLQTGAALQQALDRALNYLSFRPHSRQEVRQYLRRKGDTPETINAVLERLDSLKLVDDQAFATFWVDSRERFSPRGSHALKNELRMKGVDREIVDEMVTDEQDEERALLAGRKKALSLQRLPGMDLNTFRTRLGSFLQRRGFGYATSTRTVRALWQELQGEDET